ncbi:ABC transporter ATP-binding protein [Kordiimonas lacus]|uniref:Iron(III) transport system ATP-binding protein n=1 Tax=Kordiimonas lacus TaxID=637679 RepID=A0A1G7EV52_9PROT|nr:ABC transporter ATP-binding protein [Kordiimonas lacus]SDE67519.1 iron(III) transport system ATP-binding protein [Kordiimonas lacus]
MGKLIIDNLCKHFGDVKAVDNVSITVEDGEFLTLLGPSGCGKSTTLFAVAGLDRPTSGRILVDDVVFYDGGQQAMMPPEKRNCGLVFQSYALWPHMTVRDNLAFPLEIRKIGKSEQQKRITDALGLVEMENYQGRYPHELSGGQQQRVALARTLVYEPRLMLLDEPLSNLDAKLRIRARRWLKELQGRLGLTTIYVTHDQIEALTLSDRIAVMEGGKLVQLGTPEEIYSRPVSPFVADFIGASNFIDGFAGDDDGDTVNITLAEDVSIRAKARPGVKKGEAVRVAVRPENIRLVNGSGVPGGSNALTASIRDRDYLGARFQYILDVCGTELRMEAEQNLEGSQVDISFTPEDCIAFPA